MEAEVLVLLEADLDAQRLVVTWPKAGADWGSPELEGIPANLPVDDWAQISGVDQEDVVRLAPMLIENDIIGPMGTVDSTARSYIRARIAAKLPKATKQPGPAGGQGGSGRA